MLLIILALALALMTLSLAANVYAFVRIAQTVKELVEAREELSSVKKVLNLFKICMIGPCVITGPVTFYRLLMQMIEDEDTDEEYGYNNDLMN